MFLNPRENKKDITHFRNISEQYKMVWLAPPRTASRQTYQFLKFYDFKIHTQYRETNKPEIVFPLIPGSDYTHDFDLLPEDKELKLLCSIRNPYSRVAGLLKYHNIFREQLSPNWYGNEDNAETNNKKEDEEQNAFREAYKRNAMVMLSHEESDALFLDKLTFDEWIKRCFITKELPGIWLDQIYYHKYLKIHKPDYYIRVEYLAEDLLSIPEFRENKTKEIDSVVTTLLENRRKEVDDKNKKENWRDFYTQETADLVYENLKEQFEMFGYDRDSWKKELKLDNVTLLTVDGVNPEMALKALLYSIKQIRFKKIKLLSYRKPRGFELYEDIIEFIEIPKLTLDQYNWFKLKELDKYVDTDYCLSIEPDGFVINPDMWNVEYLNYDYIGAPWPKEGIGMLEYLNENNRVGNSGFSLRSKKLIEISKQIPDFESENNPKEDVLICRKYRNLFIENGLTFAPPELAIKFSFEFVSEEYENPDNFSPEKGKSFGFHRYYDHKNILKQIDLSKPRSHYKKPKPEGIMINFLDGVKIGNLTNQTYRVEIIGEKNNLSDPNDLKFVNILNPDAYIDIPIRYYKNWEVVLKEGTEKIYTEKLELKNKNVLIVLMTAALGDTLAWFPYVEEFRKKHECNVYCVTYHNHLFKDEYNNINFIEPKQGHNRLDVQTHAKYFISMNRTWEHIPLFDVNGNKRLQGLSSPTEYNKIPLQQISSDILGLDPYELKPRIKIEEGNRPIKEKYITISEHSTHGVAKHWLYPNGWQELVNWLNDMGYMVMVISKEPTTLDNVIDNTGDYPIQQRINEIRHADFHIGLSSGLSWLAWALDKRVVMISGFSDIFNEFKRNNVRVINRSVCHGCWHRHVIKTEEGDWCPEQKGTNKEHECSKSITTEMVIERIKKSGLLS